MSMLDTSWNWAKTAPLPVVLALNLLLGGWVYVVAQEQAKQGERVVATKEVGEKTEKQIDKVAEKLDVLLAVVLELKAELAAAKEKKK